MKPANSYSLARDWIPMRREREGKANPAFHFSHDFLLSSTWRHRAKRTFEKKTDEYTYIEISLEVKISIWPKKCMIRDKHEGVDRRCESCDILLFV